MTQTRHLTHTRATYTHTQVHARAASEFNALRSLLIRVPPRILFMTPKVQRVPAAVRWETSITPRLSAPNLFLS